MVQISERGKAMPQSPIRKLVPYAEEAKRKGRKVYHLNIGQPDLPTPEIALDAIKNIDFKVIEYSHSAGFESYRKKLAEYYHKIGVTINYTDIIITTGGSEAISFAMKTCMDPGDEIIIPEPFYANYIGFATAASLKIVPVTAHIEDGFALPPIEDFEKHITPGVKAIIICNPNNPTGYLYSKDELEKLRNIVQKHNLYLFSDEVYREFCYDGLTHYSALQLKGIDDHVVLLDSVSKRYSECGVRIGALITRNKKIIDHAIRFAQARLSPPTLGQIVGEASIDTPKEYFVQVYNEYIERRNYLVEALNKIEGVFCPMPKGAFYAMVRLPVDDADRFAQWLLEDFEYENQTVMIAPASGFYATKGRGLNEARIAYVLKKQDLEKAMKCMEVALKQYPGK
ncbi:MAG: pyridoxal phosphate-dependent aminotransferase [Bacteroidia bacterium]|nr:pyridoxal phosphate-dependent aminotransferase [Bacteroidia bacterium]